jgi:carboxymethylenebutenolidase
MIERTLMLTTASGVMPVELFHPTSESALPAVILFMDAPGIREELRDAARRIARAGFVCALPDLYYRIGQIRIDLTRRTEAHAAVYKALGGSLDNRLVAADTSILLAALAGLEEVREGLVGCIGYSLGGRFAVQAAGLFPAQVQVAAAICGTGLVTDQPDSPHSTLVGAPKAAFVLDFAAEDPQVPAGTIDTLRDAIDRAGAEADIVSHADTLHGYNLPMRPMYRAVAAEASWRRLLALLDRLKPVGNRAPDG